MMRSPRPSAAVTHARALLRLADGVEHVEDGPRRAAVQLALERADRGDDGRDRVRGRRRDDPRRERRGVHAVVDHGHEVGVERGDLGGRSGRVPRPCAGSRPRAGGADRGVPVTAGGPRPRRTRRRRRRFARLRRAAPRRRRRRGGRPTPAARPWRRAARGRRRAPRCARRRPRAPRRARRAARTSARRVGSAPRKSRYIASSKGMRPASSSTGCPARTSLPCSPSTSLSRVVAATTSSSPLASIRAVMMSRFLAGFAVSAWTDDLDQGHSIDQHRQR